MLEEKTTKNDLDEKNQVQMPDEEKLFTKKYVEKLRKECSRFRVELKKMRDDYADFSPDDVKELTALREKVSEIEKEEAENLINKKSQQINDGIMKIAESLSAIKPTQVAALLQNKIDINESGELIVIDNEETNLNDFVKGFLNANLHLVGSKGKKRGANTTPSVANMFSIEQVSRMTQEQYKKNRDRILKTLSQTSR